MLLQTLKGDVGILTTKVTSLDKEIEHHKLATERKLNADVSGLRGVIHNLHRDIVKLKKEHDDKDKTVQNKVCAY